jgi:5'(3')-deoxyribonucleotidase
VSDLKIAVDLDGVLAEAMVVWCDLYNKRFGGSLELKDIRAWEVWELVKVTRDQFFTLLDDAWLDWQKMPPTEQDVGKQVKLLCEFGAVDIVTGRSTRTLSQAKEWLKAHAIPYDQFVRTESTLAKVNLAYDVFIDDSPKLMELIASRSRALAILYTRPWNLDTQMPPIVRRVTRWVEVPPIIRAASTKPHAGF